MQSTSWVENPPSHPEDIANLLERKQHLLRSPGRKGKTLRALLKQLNASVKDIHDEAKKQQPLAFCLPSYEQAIVLNAWMYGICFLCIYCANRIGKTAVEYINVELWIYPNNPRWKIFMPYHVGDPIDDPMNANTDNPNEGKLVRVFPRPSIDALKKIRKALARKPSDIPNPLPREPYYHPQNQKVLQWLQKQVPEAYRPCFPDHPWPKGGKIWFGGPDHKHHKEILMPLWKEWLPIGSIERYTVTEQEISIKVPHGDPDNPKFTAWELIGKSYESEDTKWSSGAVDVILLTEGVTPKILKEVGMRFKDPGIGGHDFTPYEAINSGAASALAQRILTGKQKLSVPHFVFTEFTVYAAPLHIIPEDKKKGIIEQYKDDPEGKARLEGKFYSSSMLILPQLSRDIHLLPFTPAQMFQRWPNGRIYRGLDPGLDHPTACVWGYLLPSNVWIIYRILAEQGLTIQGRCQKIALKSNNKMIPHKWGKGPKDYYMVECHPKPNSELVVATVCDYHTFKQDEVTGSCYAEHYHTNGLAIIESVHTGPEDRVIAFNDLLQPSAFIQHPIKLTPPSPGVFFLQYGENILQTFEKWEELYWERLKSGDNKGQPKDKVPEHGDDELDGTCYVTGQGFRWTNFRPSARFIEDTEPEQHKIDQARRLNERKLHAIQVVSSPEYLLQRLQNSPAQEIVYFGGSPSARERDDEDDYEDDE